MSCWCGTNCSACGGECSYGCTNSCSGDCRGCYGGCSGCSGTCQGTCTATCANDCTGGCKGSCNTTCTATCANDCTGGCKGSCTGECTGGCKGTCKDACNTGCKGQAQSTIAASLSLAEKLQQSNIQQISDFVKNEVARRGGSATAASFTVGEVITASKINVIISNLSKAGQSVSSATANSTALRTLGQAIIDKALAAYNTVV